MICVLCGGVGAARFLAGLVQVVAPPKVVAVVNTGDDTELHGLAISPDIDTITYTLSSLVNEEAGWGVRGDSFRAMEALERIGGPVWFRLGDVDLATHLFRTGRMRDGATLSEVTSEIGAALGVGMRLLPMSDEPVRTRLRLRSGEEVGFQDYFVRLGHSVEVTAVRFDGVESARPAPGVLEAIVEADAIVIAPSNPVVSIGPILGVPGVADVLSKRRERVVAVSPIVAGSTLKGPADRLMRELGEEPTATGVGRRLAPVCGTLVIDSADAALAGEVESLGLSCVVRDTVMATPERARLLARAVLDAVPIAG
ncbi:MAG: 2-phospho-L-lactate transferase [Actinomycetota bacterium]|nr:2-phospho-L-lactate transferase [Actinomycetota bacterium]